MKLIIWLVVFKYISRFLGGADVDSYEINRLDFTPIMDVIIFKDIADVLNELEANPNSNTDAQSIIESDSDEDVNNLLMEYQHYLDKAHKQHSEYLEKVNNKNRVPLLRHDRYSKKQTPTKNYYDGNYQSMKPFSKLVLPSMYPFIPKIMSGPTFTDSTAHSSLHNAFSSDNRKIDELNSLMYRSINGGASQSCFCKSNTIKCNCGCPQCFVYDAPYKIETKPKYSDENMYLLNKVFEDRGLQYDKKDNFKVEVKVNIKLPKVFELFENLMHNKSLYKNNNIKDSLYMMPQYSMMSNPMHLFGYKSLSEIQDSYPIQKKKKNRVNTNKKHRKKSSYNLYNVDNNNNLTITTLNSTDIRTDLLGNETSAAKSFLKENVPIQSNFSEIVFTSQSFTTSRTLKVDNKTNDMIYLTLNITNIHGNKTDGEKLENSIETDLDKIKDKSISARVTREVKLINNSHIHIDDKEYQTTTLNKTIKEKFIKNFIDPDLLFWPNTELNETKNTIGNINTLILNTEKRKTKFNMSQDSIRNNHVVALEKAIFGEVNWDDMDTIAPVFMSFVGKYVRGMLTFCSEKKCHSMKCADKSCVHRICHPEHRFNNRGHCLGSNRTDSTATMGSIVDLPSNLAFEIVDILQDKLPEKLFGKMTICIGPKCITFIAAKKTFFKSKCTSKELSAISHCPFSKMH
ncbi:uncharacterized protein LOC126975937 [Leptidea sinapis]|uniref:uncharacterized protein LOC126975937 n=1 Tax=Leptidea sinapis TaxID=189913 RepID=UPI002137585D|nr:uncharacterized protein LOC126975937 [Leptidea sinapis]